MNRRKFRRIESPENQIIAEKTNRPTTHNDDTLFEIVERDLKDIFQDCLNFDDDDDSQISISDKTVPYKDRDNGTLNAARTAPLPRIPLVDHSPSIIQWGRFKGYNDTRQLKCYKRKCHYRKNHHCDYCNYLPIVPSNLKFVIDRETLDTEDEQWDENTRFKEKRVRFELGNEKGRFMGHTKPSNDSKSIQIKSKIRNVLLNHK